MGTELTTTLAVDSIVGSVDTGGWEASASFINDQDEAEFGRRVQIYHRPEGDGVWEEDHLLSMNGFIVPKRVTWDRGKSSTEVLITTSHYFLNNAGLQGLQMVEAAVPAHLHQIADMTLGKIVDHIVDDHTNLTDLGVDLSLIEQTDSTSVDLYNVPESRSIMNTIREIGSNEFYVPYFNRSDALVYNVHPMFADTLADPILTIDNTVLMGQPVVRYRDEVRADQVNLAGLSDSGVTLLSDYPANIGAEGRRHQEGNIRCNTQARLDLLALRLYSFLQRNFEVMVTIPGPAGLQMDLYDRVEITYSGTTANGVSFVWDEKKFWTNRIAVRRVHNFGAVTELTLDEEDYQDGYFYTDEGYFEPA